MIMWGCEKEKNENMLTEEAYVIGVHPCTLDYQSAEGKGFVLFLSKSKDTVLTFNLPPEFARKVDEERTGPLDGGYLFPQKHNGEFKIKVSYHFANEEEFIYPVCLANIYTGGISKIEKQIIID